MMRRIYQLVNEQIWAPLSLIWPAHSNSLAQDVYAWPKGDPGMESIYKWDSEGMTLNVRGATGRSDGAHIMTGPVWICGAEKDDVLQ
eukprot:1161714-Pelagomonas_calceolata.AAC.3